MPKLTEERVIAVFTAAIIAAVEQLADERYPETVEPKPVPEKTETTDDNPDNQLSLQGSRPCH